MAGIFAPHCPNCGEPVSWLAGACGYCGAPNPARRTLAIAAAATGAVLLAAVIAAVVVFRTAPGVVEGGDYAALETAMKACDEEAGKEPDTLHFMVLPLVDDPPDDPGWRRISLNEAGNGFLISAADALAGLRRGALKISRQEYVLAMRDEATNVVIRWSPSVGVKRFSSRDAPAVDKFRLQFQSRDGVGGADWGALFARQRGNCYWVNAILRR
jgi:hypothetical protein